MGGGCGKESDGMCDDVMDPVVLKNLPKIKMPIPNKAKKELPAGKPLTVVLLYEGEEIEAPVTANQRVYRAVHAVLRKREGATRLRIVETIKLMYGGLLMRPGSTFHVRNLALFVRLAVFFP